MALTSTSLLGGHGEIYHHSLLSKTVHGIIEGVGGDGYELVPEAVAMKRGPV